MIELHISYAAEHWIPKPMFHCSTTVVSTQETDTDRCKDAFPIMDCLYCYCAYIMIFVSPLVHLRSINYYYYYYVINGVHGPEPRWSRGNTSSNPQVSALIPRPAFNGMESMCHRHGSNQNSHSPVLVRKPLCYQFIRYHMSSRRVLGINRFKLCNFAVVAIEALLQQFIEAV